MTLHETNEWATLLLGLGSAVAAIWVLSKHATKIEERMLMLTHSIDGLQQQISGLRKELKDIDRRVSRLEGGNSYVTRS